MGAWGVSPFDNDEALDFVGDLEDADPQERAKLVREVMRNVVTNRDYIESSDMSAALAAAAMVAASGDPDCVATERYYPEWLVEDPLEVDEELESLAVRTLTRALRPEDNEWWELWDESDGAEQATGVVHHYLDALDALGG